MKTWKDCVDFHGHQCGGLTIGYKASLYAIQLLNLEFSPDEQVVCIAEHDACGVDAIQVMLGCSIGKGNLQLQVVGKSAYSFYNRKTGASVRLVLKSGPKGMTKAESFAYYQGCQPEDMFEVKPVRRSLPEKAQLFDSFVCDCCGELTGAKWQHIHSGKKLCPDCFENL